MPQELTLLHGSILQNVTMGDPSISGEDVRAALKIAGLLDFVDALPNGVSTDVGQMEASCPAASANASRSRVPWFFRPRLLILDEGHECARP